MKTFVKVCLSIALISIGIGIGLLILALGRRPLFSDKATYFSEDNIGDVSGLDIQVDYGEVTITEGADFSIEAINLFDKNDLNVYVSDGVWNIRHDSSNTISVFGFRVSASVNLGLKDTPKIKITVPKGFHGEDIKLSMGAGKMKASNLSANTGSFSVDAGLLEINGLVVGEGSTYNVGAGQIKLKQVDISDIIVECDVGHVSIDGIVTGDNKIYCDVGKVDLELDDNKDNYSFDVDSDLGNVIINKRAFHNKSISNLSTNYKGSFFLRVDVGNISMDFKEK